MPFAAFSGAAWTRGKAVIMDFTYLASQTFGDDELERDLLELFLAQANVLVPSLPLRDASSQDETAHLLKGSARAIGADRVAHAAEAYQVTTSDERTSDHAAYRDLVTALADAEAAILAHLRALKARVG